MCKVFIKIPPITTGGGQQINPSTTLLLIMMLLRIDLVRIPAIAISYREIITRTTSTCSMPRINDNGPSNIFIHIDIWL